MTMKCRRFSPGASKIIIFDWDDTLCPSSYMERFQIDHVSEMAEHFQKLMADVAKCAARCLQEASKYGEVIIITNSDDGWVKYSCERYMPRLLPTIGKFRVVSARTNYEKFYPAQPLCWKAAAFAHEVNELYESYTSADDSEDNNTSYGSSDSDSSYESEPAGESIQREIISFGDATEEQTSVRIVAGQLSAVPKSVMFLQNPTPLQIIGELLMLTEHMKFVCENKTSLDLEISLDQAHRYAESYLRRGRFSFDNSIIDLKDMTLKSSPARGVHSRKHGGSMTS